MLRPVDWWPDNVLWSIQDLAWAGLITVIGARAHRWVRFSQPNWDEMTHNGISHPRACIYPGFEKRKNGALSRSGFVSYCKKIKCDRFPDLSIVESDFQNPSRLAVLGWKILRAAAAEIGDPESEEASLGFIAIGVARAGLFRYQYCDVCFRIAMPGRYRCVFHSRSKLNALEINAEPYEIDVRLARRIHKGMVFDSDELRSLGSIFMYGFPVSYLPQRVSMPRKRREAALLDVCDIQDDEICCSYNEEFLVESPVESWVNDVFRDLVMEFESINVKFLADEIASLIRRVPEITSKIEADISELSAYKQLAVIRNRFDPSNPSIQGVLTSAMISKQWYERADSERKMIHLTAQTMRMVKEAQCLIEKGLRKKEVAVELGISPSNLSNILKRHRIKI